jgi:hypothetical protein
MRCLKGSAERSRHTWHDASNAVAMRVTCSLTPGPSPLDLQPETTKYRPITTERKLLDPQFLLVDPACSLAITRNCRIVGTGMQPKVHQPTSRTHSLQFFLVIERASSLWPYSKIVNTRADFVVAQSSQCHRAVFRTTLNTIPTWKLFSTSRILHKT